MLYLLYRRRRFLCSDVKFGHRIVGRSRIWRRIFGNATVTLRVVLSKDSRIEKKRCIYQNICELDAFWTEMYAFKKLSV